MFVSGIRARLGRYLTRLIEEEQANSRSTNAPDAPKPHIEQPRPEEAAADLLDEARWLMAEHLGRAESFMVRATSMLGFIGVILALLLQAAAVSTLKAGWGTWVFLGATLGTMTASALCCLMVITTRFRLVPGDEVISRTWQEFRKHLYTGWPRTQTVHNMLTEAEPAASKPKRWKGPWTPLRAAKHHADRRALWLNFGVWCLGCGLVSAVALIVDVLHAMWN
jgi:hypothetical protein